MSKHFTLRGNEYLLSAAAVLVVVADTIRSNDSGPEGRARAQRVLNDILAAARSAKFEQVDILETMLSSGVALARVLPIFDALVKRVGSELVVALVRRGLGPVPQGGV